MESGVGSKKTTIANFITMVGAGLESFTTDMLIRGDSPTSLNSKNDEDERI